MIDKKLKNILNINLFGLSLLLIVIVIFFLAQNNSDDPIDDICFWTLLSVGIYAIAFFVWNLIIYLKVFNVKSVTSTYTTKKIESFNKQGNVIMVIGVGLPYLFVLLMMCIYSIG